MTKKPSNVLIFSLIFLFLSVKNISAQTIDVYEAEDAGLSSAIVESGHSGYSGTGYVNFTANSGAKISWNNVNVPQSGNHELSFRYALGEVDRQVEVRVNGVTVKSNLNFSTTNSWSNWNNLSAFANLNSGNNMIEIITTGNDGPNIDYLHTALASNTTPTPSIYNGDTDGDGDVDIFDYNKLVSDFGQTNSSADFNGNGIVDIFDYNTLATNFGSSISPTPTPTPSPTSTPTPEPTSQPTPLPTPVLDYLPIIPGSAGFGMDTRAAYGKSGTNPTIYKVTNLSGSGTGSLTNCMAASGPRVCIFEVSGTINLGGKISVKNPYLTVAGQTAPSPGITLKGAPIEIKTHDILIQHIRVRPGSDSSVSASNLDAIGITGDRISNPEASSVYNIVLDHVSLSWAVDEVLQLYYAVHDITVTNSIISECLDNAGHPDGPHSKGLIIGENAHDITVYNNVFAHNYRRNPVIKRNTKTVVVNNVIHNWGEMGIHIPDWDTGGPQLSSIVGNVFSKGVDSNSNMIYIYSGIDPSSKIYLEDNKEFSGGSYSGATVKNGEGSHVIASSKPVWNNGLTVKSSGSVRDYVLSNAGARPADRGAVDIRVVNEVRSGGGKIIDHTSEVGGWPNLAQNHRTLNVPSNPHGDSDGDGYTNLEEWLHGYSAQVE